MRVLSRLPRNDLLLLAVGVAIVAAAVAVGVVLARADTASARPVPTVQVIPPPRGANANQALPNSTVCRIGGKCRNFSFLETVDIARDSGWGDQSVQALYTTWGGDGSDANIFMAAFSLRPQVQAAATTYFHLLYCITLRFPFPNNAYFMTASAYGPRGQYGC